ncbi:MAG: hypothetical protein RLZZ303_2255 [Candidatus Hydrogenedentota bacterium]
MTCSLEHPPPFGHPLPRGTKTRTFIIDNNVLRLVSPFEGGGRRFTGRGMLHFPLTTESLPTP